MRVLCILPNASERISGVAFARTDGGWLSESIDEATAHRFASILGYQLVREEPPPLPQPAPSLPPLPPIKPKIKP
jgi:hypothetical protein